jgi:hypothetical protein
MSFIAEKTKKDYINALKTKLSTNPEWAIHGLMVVYDYQETEEKKSSDVRFNNGVGFTPVDAAFLSSLAKQYISKGFLSEKQQVYLMKKMPKYAGQIFNYCLEKKTIIKYNGVYISEKAKKLCFLIRRI